MPDASCVGSVPGEACFILVPGGALAAVFGEAVEDEDVEP